jgi:hypothetical protein
MLEVSFVFAVVSMFLFLFDLIYRNHRRLQYTKMDQHAATMLNIGAPSARGTAD